MVEVQWPQQTQTTQVFFSSETAIHKIPLQAMSPQLKSNLGIVAIFKAHFSFASESIFI